MKRPLDSAGVSAAIGAALGLSALALAPLGCGGGDDAQQADAGANKGAAAPSLAGGAQGPSTAAAPVADAGAPEGAAVASKLPPLPMREFQERDFAETDQSRDPFRSFAGIFVAQAASKIVVQRKVLIDHYALDELKLVGLVTRTAPRALLVDPNGLGFVAKVGDFVGKAELVHAGGPTGADVAVNWRVDRIRDGDVVFIREDPSHPEIPPTTRVVALRTPEENAAQKSGGRPQ